MLTAAEKLRHYRQTIDLVDFLESEGFRLDPRKGSRQGRWIVLRDGEGLRKLVVARDAGRGYRYFNPGDDTDRGSVIDFVRSKLNVGPDDRAGWGRIFDYLDAYLGQPRPAVSPAPLPALQDASRTGPLPLALRPFSRTEYLLGRGLSERTLSAPEFTGRIFDLPFVDRFGRSHLNTAFPLETSEGRVGVILRNAGLNRIHGRKADAFWLSNVLPGEPCRELFVCESPIDALSYHQLHSPERPGQRVYVATAGSLTAGHPAALQAFINRLEPRRLLLGSDGDVSGLHYNLTWLGSLSPPGTAAPPVRIVRCNRLVELHADLSMLRAEEAWAFRSEWTRRAGLGSEASRPRSQANGGGASLVWVVPNERTALMSAECLLREVRGLDGWAEITRATEKDWNDELRIRQARRERPPVLRSQLR